MKKEIQKLIDKMGEDLISYNSIIENAIWEDRIKFYTAKSAVTIELMYKLKDILKNEKTI